MYDFKPFTPLGRVNWRNRNDLFGIRDPDRWHHLLCLGKTGTGKSVLMQNMAMDDIMKGKGLCVVDPHADAVENIRKQVPESRANDLIYFDATNKNALPSFNPLYNVPEHLRQLVASEMISTFSKLFPDAWGSRMEYTLRMAILSLMAYPSGSLLDVTALLVDKGFRGKVVEQIPDAYLKNYWLHDYEALTPSGQSSIIQPIINKIGVLLTSDILRGIFGQQASISIEECMNKSKILLCNLSKGVLGDDVSTVLGSFLITAIQTAAMRRAEIPIDARVPFYLYVDEAASFMSASFVAILTQLRKFHVGLFLAIQFLDQLEPDTKSAILGNVGSVICFKCGLVDAKLMEREFYPKFTSNDFISLPKYEIYVKLLIDGTESKGFSAVTMNSLVKA